MASVKSANVKRGYVVTVRFTDGTRRDIDFKRFLVGRMFEGLRAPARFRELKAQDGAIAWPNGADICPDVLRYNLPLAGELLTPASSLRLKRFLESPRRFDGPAAVSNRPQLRDPDISWFMGITISMECDKKARPHFRARYNNTEARFAIKSRRKLSGEMSPTAMEFVREWASLYRKELSANWTRARRGLPLKPIAPLE